MNFLKYRFYSFFAFLILVSEIIFSQNLRVNSSIISLSDQTYLTFGQGLGNRITTNGVKKLEPILFEAQVAPLFSLQFTKKVPFGFALCPKITFRMFNEYSYPVRTPSYMPFLVIYHKVKYPFLNRYNMFKYILSGNFKTKSKAS